MLVHPPTEGFLRREFWSLEGNTRLAVRRGGEAVLAELMSQGVEFIASDVYAKHLLRNLRSELERSRVKGKQDGGGDH